MPMTTPIVDTVHSHLDLDKIYKECQDMAKSYAKISAGVAIIPLPFLDVAIDVVMLSQLFPKINARFGLKDPDSFDEATRQKNILERITAIAGLVATRSVVNQTVKGFGTRLIGKQIAKYVPLGGQIFAGTLGYIIFKKVANEHIAMCYDIAKKAQQSA